LEIKTAIEFNNRRQALKKKEEFKTTPLSTARPTPKDSWQREWGSYGTTWRNIQALDEIDGDITSTIGGINGDRGVAVSAHDGISWQRE